MRRRNAPEPDGVFRRHWEKIDTNREGYETVVEAMGACVLDAILPGRGMIQAKYDADFRTMPSERRPEDADEERADNESKAASARFFKQVFGL